MTGTSFAVSCPSKKPTLYMRRSQMFPWTTDKKMDGQSGVHFGKSYR